MNLNDYLMYLKSTLSGNPFPQRKPERIQFPINDVCNARCVMCNIWQKHKTHEISALELAKILQDPLFSEVKAVGINGGEPTLRRDLPELAEVLINELPQLRSLSLITNGLHRQRAAENIHRLSAACRLHNIHLNVMVSLDGVGDLHDFVRGRDGNFVNADGLLDDLISNNWADTIQLGCTVVSQNVYGIHELLDYANQKGVYIKYRLGVPHRRLYKPADDGAFTLGKTTWPDLKPFQLSDDQTLHFAEFLLNLVKHYEKSYAQQWFYRSLVGQILEGKPRQAGCAWRNAGVTLTSRAELAYCAVESDTIGNAAKISPSQLYWSNSEHLNEIKQTKCDSCHHDYGGMPEGINLRRFVAERLMTAPKVRQILNGVKDTTLGAHLEYRHNRYIANATIRRLGRLQASQDILVNQQRAVRQQVIICGWYGTETAGDKAILGGVISALRAAMGDIDIHLTSLYPHISKATLRQMPELGQINVVTVDEAGTLIDQASLIAFGGGPLMAIPRMAVMVGLFERAAKRGVPTLVAGCGVGPMGGDLQNSLVRRLLLLSSMRIYRDESSRILAGKLGIDTDQDLVAEDPAFTWIEGVNSSIHIMREPRRLLLGLRDWPFKDYASHIDSTEAEAMKNAFDSGMVSMLSELVSQHDNLVIAAIPMCTNSYGGDDRFYYLKTLCGNPQIRKAMDMTLLGKELTPEQYLMEFRRSKFAITMRFHSLVFAAATRTGCIALDYTMGKGKVSALANRLGVSQFSIANIDWQRLKNEISLALLSTPQNVPPPPAATFRDAVAKALFCQDVEG
jgi:polysaccharide pyruvyl transferase WcaK-like protein/MoaA/NifB/PqqE/SkfB family radical SAM enzyme